MTVYDKARTLRHAAGEWLREPGAARRLAQVVVPALVIAGLLLPPVSLLTRIRSLGYSVVRADADTSIPSDPPGAWLEIRRHSTRKSTRVRVTGLEDLPRGVDPFPTGYARLGRPYRLDFRGVLPREGWLNIPLTLEPGMESFVDPFGWDGERWRWLAPQFATSGRVRIRLPFSDFQPLLVVPTLATAASTEVSAVLLEPPAVPPAAAAELPILELRTYHLADYDGTVSGRPFPVPSDEARIYGVLDNREGPRYRTDLVNNLLILPESRQRHREQIVGLVRRDGLDGIVLDYYGIATDLQHVYADFVGRLTQDLRREDAELIVTVPMPQRISTGWDGQPYAWQTLGATADAVRIRLPDDAPLETEVLDSMIRWALEQVNRRQLQLALPIQGRDVVEGEVQPIGFGEALGRILDLAESDAPNRIVPGVAAQVELPTVRAAELGRDPETGMWKFYYWGPNRLKHTVWLNDAAGLKPALEIAARYRLGRVALDGVAVGIDPSLWRMVRDFTEEGQAPAVPSSYRLSWRLMDDAGRLVQEAIQPLEDPVFRFQAPSEEGEYQLGVNLINDEGQLVALGDTWRIVVGPPLPPPPTPTLNAVQILPTPEVYVTAPPPPDEALIRRTPVKAERTGTPEPEAEADAVVSFARAELRSGPGFGHETLSDLKPGERLEALGRSADSMWLKVRVTGTGVEGWVSVQLLEVNIDLARLPIVAEPTPTP